MRWTSALLWVVLVQPALSVAAPPPLRLVGPRADAWAGTNTDFTVALDGGPFGTAFTRVEFEVQNTDGTRVTGGITSVTPTSTSASRNIAVTLDAGPYQWTARSLDSSDASVWAPPESFRWDGDPPPAPAITLEEVDAGYVRVSYTAVVDVASGLEEYHVSASFEGIDAGFNFPGSNLTTTALWRSTWLGPGRWSMGVHAHDLAGNVGAFTSTPPIDVVASPQLGGVAPTTPVLVLADGGPAPIITNATTVRARWTSPFDGGVFVVGRRSVGEGTLAIAATRFSPIAFLDHYDDGFFEVQVAHALDGLISEWSQPTRYLIDQTRPFTPAVMASVDGGFVALRWTGVNDRGGPASGVSHHQLSRGATVLGTFDAGLATYTFGDEPGGGVTTYSVRVFDVAGNASVGSATVVIGAPPALEAPLAGPAASRGPVSLSWDAGGVVATFDVSREDVAGSAVVVASVPGTTFDDAAPEGTWRYRVRARIAGIDGLPSPPSSAVVVDQTAPTGALDARRRAASSIEVTWTALDALAGVASVTLEREATGGAVTSLGAQASSPFTDLPPDGSWRYRLVVVDQAGNSTTTPFTAEVRVPGPVVRLEVPAVEPLQCYQPAEVPLTTTGEPATRWLVVDAPEGVALGGDGVLRWTPRSADVGPQTVRVRVEGAESTDERDVPLEVTCRPRALSVGCSAAPALPLALGLLAAALRLRRRR